FRRRLPPQSSSPAPAGRGDAGAGSPTTRTGWVKSLPSTFSTTRYVPAATGGPAGDRAARAAPPVPGCRARRRRPGPRAPPRRGAVPGQVPADSVQPGLDRAAQLADHVAVDVHDLQRQLLCLLRQGVPDVRARVGVLPDEAPIRPPLRRLRRETLGHRRPVEL